MVDFVQKQVLDPASFSNANTNAIDAVKVRVDSGSVVGDAIAAAIASGTVPAATDTVQGKVALNLGTAAGDATNATDALTATGLAAILNGTAPNATPNALQAAVASNPSQYGTFASVLAPTAAPTAANPATRLTNSNGEVFDWTGTAWVLVGNGLLANTTGSLTAVADNTNGIGAAYTCPRSGQIQVRAFSSGIFSLGTTPMIAISYSSFGEGSEATVRNAFDGLYLTNSNTISVTAGQIITTGVYNSSGNGATFTGTSNLTIKYLA